MRLCVGCQSNGNFYSTSLDSPDWECVSLNLLECITAGIQLAL